LRVSQPLRVLIVSGIWPPDVGGPASHGPDLGRFLVERGAAVRAIVTGDVPAEPRGLALHTLPRRVPVVRRMAEAPYRLLRETRHASVVYSTGLYTRAAAARTAWGTPLVLKLVADPAYERARSLGLYDGPLDAFGPGVGDARIDALIRIRDLAVSRAAEVVVPSEYLAGRIATWNIGATPVRVIPNAAPVVTPEADREALRRRLGLAGPTIVFAGRLVLQKNVPLAVRAMRDVDARASLVIIGEGPAEGEIRAAIAEQELREDRVRVLPPVSREDAIRWMQAADVTVLPSDWENHPHAAVESLAVGTPVVATAVGGVGEIITESNDGALVPAGDARALGRALTEVLARREQHGNGSQAAALGRLGPPRAEVFAQIEAVLRRHARC
jgi:glycosyltransferase involved in cell wall biosynthesis